MKRTVEDALGLTGAILGLLCSLIILLLGEMEQPEGAKKCLTIGCIGVFFSIVGFLGFIKAKSTFKEAGCLMILSAIGLFICINQTAFYFFPGLALLISGLNNIFGKKKI
ncbi:hypothetical protein [Bacillus cereus group sp. BfR-BA-01380]|uniref:hypothetical protein n=1 Tax=Bacillus cereus group sp. BfR-BA-01380 TaxID=2920324 RepID=UPI001F5629D3|nr:hypothetical protein [Bacillus cereus group sp. BfR-BA-01380]